MSMNEMFERHKAVQATPEGKAAITSLQVQFTVLRNAGIVYELPFSDSSQSTLTPAKTSTSMPLLIDISENSLTLGSFLKMRRTELSEFEFDKTGIRITQASFAKKVGISVDWYRKIEQDKAIKIGYNKLLQIAEGLDLTKEELQLFLQRFSIS